MAKSTAKKIQSDDGAPVPSDVSSMNIDPRRMESTMHRVLREMERQQFNTLKEAEAYLQKLIGQGGLPPEPEALTPLEEAQELVWEALDETGAERLELLIRALATSWDCADAYNVLAEEVALTAEEALSLYEQGMKAAERTLDPKLFTEAVGHFWGMMETRPYMRSRAGVAESLFAIGRRREAIDHYHELIRLNPNDNQGLRYLLVNYLIREKAIEECDRLFEQFGTEETAVWLFPRALWLFLKHGESDEATTALRQAIVANPSVPPYLLGRKPLPILLPEYMEVGKESEAIHCANEGDEAWSETPGALEWLGKHVNEFATAKGKGASKRSKGGAKSRRKS